MTSVPTRPDYGIDAPAVMRNLFLIGGACLLFGLFGPHSLSVGPVNFKFNQTLLWISGVLLGEGLLFLLYVKVGKFRHRDFILGLYRWSGNEQVLDVGCGRGLLLAGAAKRLASQSRSKWRRARYRHRRLVERRHGGNSPQATQRNLELEGIASL